MRRGIWKFEMKEIVSEGFKRVVIFYGKRNYYLNQEGVPPTSRWTWDRDGNRVKRLWALLLGRVPNLTWAGHNTPNSERKLPVFVWGTAATSDTSAPSDF